MNREEINEIKEAATCLFVLALTVVALIGLALLVEQ